jgi:hypothetical protein
MDAPVLDERTGRLVGGHGRLEDAKARRDAGGDLPDGFLLADDGTWLIGVQRGWSSTDDEQAHAAGVALNQGTIAGGWKRDELADLLSELAAGDDPTLLAGTGFDESSLNELLADVAGFPVLPGSRIPAAVLVPVDDLQPHPQNYQDHPDDQLEHLGESMAQFSFFKNIVAARDGVILAGHGAWFAAKRKGLTAIPTVRLDLASDSPQALKIIAADNEIGRFAVRDDRSLADLLKTVRDGDPFGLAGTGYDEMILANLAMVTRSKAELQDFDAAAEWVGMPGYEPKAEQIRLVINFETAAERDRFVTESFDGTVSKRVSTSVWSAHWPIREEPRESRNYRWQTDADEPQPEPEP